MTQTESDLAKVFYQENGIEPGFSDIRISALYIRVTKDSGDCRACGAHCNTLSMHGYCEICSLLLGPLEGRNLNRMRVRIRDKFTCQGCGKVVTPTTVTAYNKRRRTLKGRIKNLDVHHIDGMCGKNSVGYDSEKAMSTLVTLCHKCHYNRHDHSVRAREKLSTSYS